MLRFRVSPQAGELVTENNAREALIDVRDRKEKILYFEGEPRSEIKFIRRAVPKDDNLIVTALQRTADNKYMRHRRRQSRRTGRRRSRRRARSCSPIARLILGSIEAGAFTGDQLRDDLRSSSIAAAADC